MLPRLSAPLVYTAFLLKTTDYRLLLKRLGDDGMEVVGHSQAVMPLYSSLHARCTLHAAHCMHFAVSIEVL